MRTRTGAWLTAHAERLGPTLVSVILEPTRPHEVAQLWADAYGLTNREREVAALAVRGLTNARIAASLFLSPFTVQDHLKQVFTKTGVAGRTELGRRYSWRPEAPIRGAPSSQGTGAPLRRSRRARPRLPRVTSARTRPAEHVERALGVVAHPDDVDFGSAGTVATLDRRRRRGDLLHRDRRGRRRHRRDARDRMGPLRQAEQTGGRGRVSGSPTSGSSAIPTGGWSRRSSCGATSAG